MTVFENDGSYPGNVCASTVHAHHEGLKDSQWKQRKQIENLYRWMCENGIYMNIPDYGYLLNGGNKVGIGYREVNWSLSRERRWFWADKSCMTVFGNGFRVCVGLLCLSPSIMAVEQPLHWNRSANILPTIGHT